MIRILVCVLCVHFQNIVFLLELFSMPNPHIQNGTASESNLFENREGDDTLVSKVSSKYVEKNPAAYRQNQI